MASRFGHLGAVPASLALVTCHHGNPGSAIDAGDIIARYRR